MADVPASRCCDLCNPSLLDRVRPGQPPATQRQTTIKKGIASDSVRNALYAWRRTIKNQYYPKAVWAPQAILDNATCELLASVGPVNTKARLEQLIRSTWHRWEQHSNELFELLRDLNIPPLPTPVNSASKKRAAAASTSQPATLLKRPRITAQSATATAPQPTHPAITLSSQFSPAFPVPSSALTPLFHSASSPYVPTPLYPHAPPSNIAQYPAAPSTPSHTLRFNNSFPTPTGLNLPTTSQSIHHPMLAGMRSSQFDSPAFNRSHHWQPSSNLHPYNMPATHTPHTPMTCFPSTPHFQAGQYSRPSFHTPLSHPYQSLPDSRPSPSLAQYHTSQSQLNSSPFIVIPSQYRNTPHRDIRQVRETVSEVQYNIPRPSSSNFSPGSNESFG
jgi:hypothetical protein